jgi:hypothetical protein
MRMMICLMVCASGVVAQSEKPKTEKVLPQNLPLDQAIENALKRHPDLELAMAKLRVAEIEVQLRANMGDSNLEEAKRNVIKAEFVKVRFQVIHTVRQAHASVQSSRLIIKSREEQELIATIGEDSVLETKFDVPSQPTSRSANSAEQKLEILTGAIANQFRNLDKPIRLELKSVDLHTAVRQLVQAAKLEGIVFRSIEEFEPDGK